MPSVDHASKLKKAREQIAAAKEAKQALTQSLISRETAYARLDDWIAQTGAEDGERYIPSGGEFTAPHPGSVTLARGDRSIDSLLCWLLPDVLRAAMRKRIDAVYKLHGDGISSEDRRARDAELDAQLLQIEIAEERIILAAEADGIHLPRRGDANPAAILAA
jgi:hypothetical protein